MLTHCILLSPNPIPCSKILFISTIAVSNICVGHVLICVSALGVKILFRVGLVLLKCMLGTQDKVKSCQGLYETMELLKKIKPQYMRESFLVQEVGSVCCPFSLDRRLPESLTLICVFQIIDLPVSEKNIEKEHQAQLRRWKESHGDLSCKSPPRMHGAKAIMAAEPPSRQELRQRPTIIVESPLASKTDVAPKDEERGSKKPTKENGHTTVLPTEGIANAGGLSPALKHMTVQQSKESLSSGEQDTYL